ncbi:MAG: hypothetical protein L0K41_06295 [Yaniella sp.]|uniref:hypothetical protein n=1 Tax=Yaniella sp. TaxID=2773929 RepID=UPI00264785AB|nr:hypothetical protein [Yaniella sp.]MDN5731039.1 hypothetical protein [Yaniella sp.]MDN5815052.1 hypothetical protein [Yaniella sp.]MDN5817686.1 hypothetical protein [Yaniella sp.]MDN5838191.1 hypothetical protein [Yaniella sp.]MDN5890057.1 hypothetical protein [Yaniella sp.]
MIDVLSSQKEPVPTGGIDTQPSLAPRYETRSSYTRESSVLRRQVKDLTDDSQETHRNAVRIELDHRSHRWARQSTHDLLSELRSWGFAWRDVARIVGVSVPALQKWRKGASQSSTNRLKLAQFVALVEYVEHELLINDVASWLEMPIRTGVHLTALDLLAENREVLVIELASEQATPEKVLDEFEPEWREKLVDNAFEVFTASDGSKAIRPRD